MNEIGKQIELLKKYRISNYTVKKNRIIINEDNSIKSWSKREKFSYIRKLSTIDDEDFLKDVTINDDLYLNNITSVKNNFLKGATINGGLCLDSLKEVGDNFLEGVTINGGLYLGSLKDVGNNFIKSANINISFKMDSIEEVSSGFLEDTIINGPSSLNGVKKIKKNAFKGTIFNGMLQLESLEEFDKDSFKEAITTKDIWSECLWEKEGKDIVIKPILKIDKENIIKNNIKRIEIGYNEKYNIYFLYYDRFNNNVSKVLKVRTKDNFTIYTTPTEYIIEKENVALGGKTIKRAMKYIDLELARLNEIKMNNK